MDGLGLYTVEEMAEQLEHYTPPIEPVWHGGHLTEAWHRMRNMWTFWPWYRQEAGRRLDESMPALADLHQMTFDMLRARPDWGLAYRAAFRYDARAALARPAGAGGAARQARRPAARAPRPAAASRRRRWRCAASTTPPTSTTWWRPSTAASAWPTPRRPPRGRAPRRYDAGPTCAPRTGSATCASTATPPAPPLLLVHGSPGSADSFEGLIGELARDHLVVSPDTLGNGYSSAPCGEDPRIEQFAAADAAVLDALGLAGVTAYGSHTGACIALELACQRPDLVAGVVADGLPVLEEEERADLLEHYFISMAPERHGEHLLRAWHTIRDVQLFWPWYRQTAATARPTAPSEPAHLHRLVLEFLKSGPTYRHSYRAAFLFDSRERLAAVSVPTLVCAAPEDMLRRGSEEVSGEGRVRFVELDHAAGRDAAWAVRQA